MLIIMFIIRNKKHLAVQNKLCIIIIIKNKMYYSITYHHYKSRPPFQIKEYLYNYMGDVLILFRNKAIKRKKKIL